MKRANRARQAQLIFPKHGGARRGAGRKRIAELECAPHRTRPRLSGRNPLHVTLRLVAGLPSLRLRAAHELLRAALRAGADRHGFRLVHYGAVSNHLHLVCEAESERALTRGMRGIAARIVRALNRFFDRAGPLFADRYHARELRVPRDMRNVLIYVFGNARRHGVVVTEVLDPCSSAGIFDGWKEHAQPRDGPTWLAMARTWLLTVGWRRHGKISVRERARAAPCARLEAAVESRHAPGAVRSSKAPHGPASRRALREARRRRIPPPSRRALRAV